MNVKPALAALLSGLRLAAAASAQSAQEAEPAPSAVDAAASIEAILAEARGCETAGEVGEAFIPPERAAAEGPAAYNARLAQAFLEANRARACVFETPTGLQLQIIVAQGEPSPSPASGDLVTVVFGAES